MLSYGCVCIELATKGEAREPPHVTWQSSALAFGQRIVGGVAPCLQNQSCWLVIPTLHSPPPKTREPEHHELLDRFPMEQQVGLCGLGKVEVGSNVTCEWSPVTPAAGMACPADQSIAEHQAFMLDYTRMLPLPPVGLSTCWCPECMPSSR